MQSHGPSINTHIFLSHSQSALRLQYQATVKHILTTSTLSHTSVHNALRIKNHWTQPLVFAASDFLSTGLVALTLVWLLFQPFHKLIQHHRPWREQNESLKYIFFLKYIMQCNFYSINKYRTDAAQSVHLWNMMATARQTSHSQSHKQACALTYTHRHTLPTKTTCPSSSINKSAIQFLHSMFCCCCWNVMTCLPNKIMRLRSSSDSQSPCQSEHVARWKTTHKHRPHHSWRDPGGWID